MKSIPEPNQKFHAFSLPLPLPHQLFNFIFLIIVIIIPVFLSFSRGIDLNFSTFHLFIFCACAVILYERIARCHALSHRREPNNPNDLHHTIIAVDVGITIFKGDAQEKPKNKITSSQTIRRRYAQRRPLQANIAQTASKNHFTSIYASIPLPSRVPRGFSMPLSSL